jgi:hypothetical protein
MEDGATDAVEDEEMADMTERIGDDEVEDDEAGEGDEEGEADEDDEDSEDEDDEEESDDEDEDDDDVRFRLSNKSIVISANRAIGDRCHGR